ncbi:MAG: 16S rRNA (uracil(1498)-N(3))-methyltransferase [Kiritimatiellales bacterium]|nr:16S rRNA (uracil(1498)-N(3))-methyltransferase [Kiritimatiellales bacterium]
MRINSLVDAGELEKDIVVLSPDESHHLARVLRVQAGQEITLFDGQGNVADAVVESVGKSAVEARVSRRWNVPPPAVQIDLIQAVPKPDRWELVLQKAVELGASNIYPILSQHTEFKPNDKKMERWQKIVLNAAQQCEVRWLPTLHPLEKFGAVLPMLGNYDLVLVGSLYEGATPFREALKNFPMIGKKKVALLIGPEGDFSEEEVQAAIAAGAVPVSFGERILRTETAAIFGLSVLAYELL